MSNTPDDYTIITLRNKKTGKTFEVYRSDMCLFWTRNFEVVAKN